MRSATGRAWRSPPKITFDWQEWLPYVEDSDLTDAQKREMIETLWAIVIAFVDLGWEVSDAEQETCGQALDLRAALEAAVLYSKASSATDEPSLLPIDLGTEKATQNPDKKEEV